MFWFLITIVGLTLLVTVILLLQVAIAKYVGKNNGKEKM